MKVFRKRFEIKVCFCDNFISETERKCDYGKWEYCSNSFVIANELHYCSIVVI